MKLFFPTSLSLFISINRVKSCLTGIILIAAAQPFIAVYAHNGIISISSCSELQAIENNLSGIYELASDIDCNNKHIHPIGSTAAPFTGELNGRGYKISNLPILSNQWGQGIFGATYQQAIVRDLILENINASGSANIGALIGIAHGDTLILNVKLRKSNLRGAYNIGGLIGQLISGQIVDSSAEDITINYDSSSVGGLVGRSSGDIINSHATASIYAEFEGPGEFSDAGGLVGSSSGSIADSYAKGYVSGDNNIGGLVGTSSGAIQNSFAETTISNPNNEGSNVGGLIGNATGDVTNSYAEGNISGSQAGGLIGYSRGNTVSNSYAKTNISGSGAGLIYYCYENEVINNYAIGEIDNRNTTNSGLINNAYFHVVINSYWDVITTQQFTSSGGTGKTTSDMFQQSTYEGWDFDNVWEIEEGSGYPTLRNTSF